MTKKFRRNKVGLLVALVLDEHDVLSLIIGQSLFVGHEQYFGLARYPR